MKAQFSHVHWGQVLLTGVLVAIQVFILSTVLGLLVLFAFNVLGQPDQSWIAIQVASWSIGIILAILLTVRGGVRVAHKVARGAPLHGLLLGLVAALILLGPAFIGGLNLAVLVTFVLTVAAGWLGGVLGSRGREKS